MNPNNSQQQYDLDARLEGWANALIRAQAQQEARLAARLTEDEPAATLQPSPRPFFSPARWLQRWGLSPSHAK